MAEDKVDIFVVPHESAKLQLHLCECEDKGLHTEPEYHKRSCSYRIWYYIRLSSLNSVRRNV